MLRASSIRLADPAEAEREYAITLCPWDELPAADVLVRAVSHRALLARPLADLLAKVKPRGCFIDAKSRFDPLPLREAGLHLWQLWRLWRL
ncbi:hypothetical protein CSQ96_11790 [Janthinobacterium sp. BJB412]|nr:hypothetical protein CSQ96_11790 [Janthinobacterium sp. BJB412]